MKIKRTIAAVMALVLVGGAYPLNTVNTRSLSRTYAAEAATEEKEPQFLAEKETYKRLEPFTIAVKNVDPASVSFIEDNIENIDKTTDENGNLVYTFKSRKSGEAHLIIEYGFDGEMRQKQFTFNILEETYEDENSPQFLVENETYKRLEPFTIAVKNVDPASVSFIEENIENIDKTTDENGNLVYTFKSRKSGEAHLIIEYGFDGEMRQKQFTFNILEETYEDENSPQFLVENETYKRLEPFTIAVKNVDPASVSFIEENIENIDKTTDENGNLVYTFKSRKSGEAHLIIEYGFDGEMRQKQFTFNILEETYEDENSPKFLVENETYKRLEPFTIAVKNVDPASVSFVEDNIENIDKTTDENGNLVYTFKSRKSGEAHLIIEYGFDGEMRQKQFTFNILDETYEDENSPKFLVENETYKRLEPFSIAVKNVDPASVSFIEENIENIDKTTDENGNLVYTFKSRKSGEAHLIIEYGFDGEMRQKQFTFNILDEDYEEETTHNTNVKGDANCDGTVDMSDVVLIMQALANPDKFGVNGTNKLHITQQGVNNSDVDTRIKGLTVSDALKIQLYLLGGIKNL